MQWLRLVPKIAARKHTAMDIIPFLHIHNLVHNQEVNLSVDQSAVTGEWVLQCEVR